MGTNVSSPCCHITLETSDQMLDLIVHGKMTLQETTRHHFDELQVCDITCIVHYMNKISLIECSGLYGPISKYFK